MTEQGGSRAEAPILAPPCVKCGHKEIQHIYDTGPCRPGWVCDCSGFEPMQGDEDAERLGQSTERGGVDGDDSGHGRARDRDAQERAMELVVLAERMRRAIFNIRLFLRDMEDDNERLRKAAEKWSEL